MIKIELMIDEEKIQIVFLEKKKMDLLRVLYEAHRNKTLETME